MCPCVAKQGEQEPAGVPASAHATRRTRELKCTNGQMRVK
jgi:hypothetical protein